MNIVRSPGARITVREKPKCMWALRGKSRDSAEGHVQVTHFRTQSPTATQASALGTAESWFKVSSLKRKMIPRGRTRSKGHKLKHMKFDLQIRKTFLWWRWLNTGTGCSERFWSLWRSSEDVWVWYWATYLEWPCLMWDVESDNLQSSLLTSAVLWRAGLDYYLVAEEQWEEDRNGKQMNLLLLLLMSFFQG